MVWGVVIGVQGRAQAPVRSDVAPGRVWRVDERAAPLGHADFVDLQPAVDAARDRDLILVSPGRYGVVAIQKKSLVLVRDGAGEVALERFTVEGLAASQRVLVRGLGNVSSSVTVRNNEGAVWFEDCELSRATFESCRSLTLARSVVWKGVRARGVTSLFLYDCGVNGATGTTGHGQNGGFFGTECFLYPSGDGEVALDLAQTEAFVSGCELRGGTGGYGSGLSWCCAFGGDGGAALALRAGGRAALLGTNLVGGPGGSSGCTTALGAEGPPLLLDGGEAIELEGPARRYRIVDAVVRSDAALSLAFVGVPGDVPFLLWTEEPLLDPDATLELPSLVPLSSPSLAFAPLKTGSVETDAGAFPVGRATYRAFFTQSFFKEPTTPVRILPGPPSSVVVVDDSCRGVPPVSDCDDDGLDDACEVLSGVAPDADGDGLPDACTVGFFASSGPLTMTSRASIDVVFPGTPRPSGPVRVRVSVRGTEALTSGASFALTLNGFPLATLFRGNGATCDDAVARAIVLDGGIYEELASDGDAVFTVTPPSFTACTEAVVTLDVGYPRAEADANGNFVDDVYELGPLTDCDGNGELDRSELELRASASTVPFNVYFPIEVSIPGPARSASDVVVYLHVALDSQSVFLYVNETVIGSFYTQVCPGRAEHTFVIARRRWNAIVGSGPARVYALADGPSSACADGGALSVRWTDAALDCNGNGRLDSCDVASGRSLDVNANGIPDECEP